MGDVEFTWVGNDGISAHPVKQLVQRHNTATSQEVRQCAAPCESSCHQASAPAYQPRGQAAQRVAAVKAQAGKVPLTHKSFQEVGRYKWLYPTLMLLIHSAAAWLLVPRIVDYTWTLVAMYASAAWASWRWARLIRASPGLLPRHPCAGMRAADALAPARFWLWKAQVEQFGLAAHRPGDAHALQLCGTCGLQQPGNSRHVGGPRGACIANFDHVCIWTGGPVGALNHAAFVQFLLAQIVHLACALLAWLAYSVATCHNSLHPIVCVASSGAFSPGIDTPGAWSERAAGAVAGLAGWLFWCFCLVVLAEQVVNAAYRTTINARVQARKYAQGTDSPRWSLRQALQPYPALRAAAPEALANAVHMPMLEWEATAQHMEGATGTLWIEALPKALAALVLPGMHEPCSRGGDRGAHNE